MLVGNLITGFQNKNVILATYLNSNPITAVFPGTIEPIGSIGIVDLSLPLHCLLKFYFQITALDWFFSPAYWLFIAFVNPFSFN